MNALPKWSIQTREPVLPPPGWTPPSRCILIAGVHRSGSTLLCKMMEATGCLGIPDEYFKPSGKGSADRAEIERRMRLPLEKGQSANGIAAVKVFANHFRDIAERCNLSGWYPRLDFVFVQRRDKLGQAISWARANQTKQFRAWDKVKAEPHYSCEAIQSSLAKILAIEAEWQFLFARNAVEPLTVTYEDFVADPQATLTAIATLVDVEPPEAMPSTDALGLTVQRDDLNAEWRRRFLEDAGGLDRFDALDDVIRPDRPRRGLRGLLG